MTVRAASRASRPRARVGADRRHRQRAQAYEAFPALWGKGPVFEWDRRKAAANLRKYGVSFDEAATVFADSEALDGPDATHSVQEERFLRLGRSLGDRVLMVAYTLRRSGHAEAIRIISARRASRKERVAYRGGSPD